MAAGLASLPRVWHHATKSHGIYTHLTHAAAQTSLSISDTCAFFGGGWQKMVKSDTAIISYFLTSQMCT